MRINAYNSFASSERPPLQQYLTSTRWLSLCINFMILTIACSVAHAFSLTFSSTKSAASTTVSSSATHLFSSLSKEDATTTEEAGFQSLATESTVTDQSMLFNNYHDDEDKKFEIYCETNQVDLAYMAWKEWMAWAPQDVNLIQNRSISLIQCLCDQVVKPSKSTSSLSSSSSSKKSNNKTKKKKKTFPSFSNITVIASRIVATDRAMEVVDMLWKLHQINYHAFVDLKGGTTDDENEILVPTPTEDVYGTVISMLAHVGRYDEARTFLQQLEEFWYRNKQIAQQNSKSNRNDGAATEQYHHLALVKPTVSLYNMLLEAIARGKISDVEPTAAALDDNAADIAGSIVNHMESLKDDTVAPNTATYNHLLRACLRPIKLIPANEKKQSGESRQQKGQLIDALNGVQRADQTLSWMYERSQQQQQHQQVDDVTHTVTDVAPNEESFELVINAWTAVATASIATRDSGSDATPVMTAENGGIKDGTARAENWLNRMEEKYVPSASLLSGVVSACCDYVKAANASTSSDKAEKLVMDKVEEKQSGTDAAATPGNNSNYKIRAYQRQLAERAQRLLLRMETLYRAGANQNLKPSALLYERVANAWIECGEELQAQYVLQRQNEATSADSTENKLLSPENDRVMDAGLIDLRTPLVGSVEKDRFVGIGIESSQTSPSRFSSEQEIIEALTNEFKLSNPWLRLQMEELSNEEQPSLKPTFPATTLTLNLIINELANTRRASAGQRAEDLLYFMLEQSLKRGNKGVQPDIVTFNSAILAWSKSSNPNSAVRAEGILKTLRDLHEKGFLLDVQPDLVSYNSIINGYAKSRGRGATRNAERLFKELVSLHRSTRDTTYKPDLITYSSLLNAFANTGDADRAEEILLNMQKQYKSDPRKYPCPDTACFNQVLYAHARSKKRDAGKRSEMLLRLMEDMSSSKTAREICPDTQTYNIALFSWSNCGDPDAPYRAQILFERMKEGNFADRLSYTTLIAAWCKLGGQQGLEAAKRIVNEAISEDSAIVVNADFISNVLYSVAMADDTDMPKVAEEIVVTSSYAGIEVEHVDVYNALLNCWAKSGNRHVPKRVMEILEDLENKSTNSGTLLAPDEKTYTIVLDALAKSRNSESILMAEKVLEKMEKSSTVEPNVQTYTAMIQNYARSKLRNKAPKAYALLKRMKRGSARSRPTTLSYNALLNACEFTLTTDIKEAEEAFRVACATFDEMRSRKVKLSHVTYGSFLGVIANHMPKSDVRTDLVSLVFKRCVQEGKVSPLVLKKLRGAAVSSMAYRELLQGYSRDNLPSDWTCNVNDRRWKN